MVMGKKLFVLILFILMLNNIYSSGINNYVVSETVALGQRITATGFYEDGNNSVNNIKCSFYFLNDLNVIIERATDEYTTNTGRFVLTPFLINEPTFLRGKEYILRTECNVFSDEKTVLVVQRENLTHFSEQEFDFITDPNNTMTIMLWFFVLLMLGSVIGFFIWFRKEWGRK